MDLTAPCRYFTQQDRRDVAAHSFQPVQELAAGDLMQMTIGQEQVHLRNRRKRRDRLLVVCGGQYLVAFRPQHEIEHREFLLVADNT